jgi:hypothetical protein
MTSHVASRPATSDSAAMAVVVGDGIVGRRVGQFLGAGHDVVHVDLRHQDLHDAPAGSLVVLAQPGPHAMLAAELIRRGVVVVSIDDDLDDAAQLLDLDDDAVDAGVPLVVGAGLSPGLSGMLARQLARQLVSVEEVHVAVHGTAGPACARQHHRALRGRASGWRDGDWIRRPAGSGRELCWFPEPVGARDCYRAEVSAPLLLHRAFPDATRISARLSATRRDRLTARLPMLRRPHPEGGVGAARVEVRGSDPAGARVTLIAGVAERVGTAAAATAAVFATAAGRGELPAGVVVPGDDRLDTAGLLARLEHHGIRLQEFTGVPR